MIEWLIIYCMLYSNKKLGHVLSLLRQEYFGDELTKSIYLYIVELYSKNISPTIEVILSKFPEKQEEIKKYLDVTVDLEVYEELIKNLRDTFVNRKIKQLASQISSKSEINEEKFVSYVQTLIEDIAVNKADNTKETAEYMDEVLNEANSEEVIKSNVVYGIPEIDDITNGLFPGEYIVIASRPSMGKTSLMAHIAINNALAGNVVLMFSLEMEPKKIGIKFLSNVCDMELWKLKRIKNRTEEEQKKMTEVVQAIKDSTLIIDNTSNLDIQTLQSVIQKYYLRYKKIDLVIVDYLQLMNGQGENDNSRISNLSRGLKATALRFHTPLIAGSQLSRLCEQRDNKRPILSDLRDSGSIEQDADLVFMLYRDCYYTGNQEHERILEVLRRKYRNGEIGKNVIEYNTKKQTFKTIRPNSQLGQLAKRFMYE